VAGFHGGAAERDGEVGFADARRTEEQHVLGACDEPTGRELADELRSTDGWRLKSNSSSRFTAGKCAIWIPIATRFFCFASVSSARIWSRKSR
jgi:hypothetical protein